MTGWRRAAFLCLALAALAACGLKGEPSPPEPVATEGGARAPADAAGGADPEAPR